MGPSRNPFILDLSSKSGDTPLLTKRYDLRVFGDRTRLLFDRLSRGSSGSRKPWRHGGIVDFDPGPHAFGRFQIKALLHSQPHKRLRQAKVCRVLQLPFKPPCGLRGQEREHLRCAWQVVSAVEKAPECVHFLDDLGPVSRLRHDLAWEEVIDHFHKARQWSSSAGSHRGR
jgi:hypothetical protein